MAKTAEDRYQSAWGIKADLKNCLAQSTYNYDLNVRPMLLNTSTLMK